MSTKIKIRRDIRENWENINPILSDGEVAIDKSNRKLKIGDGVTNWNDLPFIHYTPEEITNKVNFFSIFQKVTRIDENFVNDNYQGKHYISIKIPATLQQIHIFKVDQVYKSSSNSWLAALQVFRTNGQSYYPKIRKIRQTIYYDQDQLHDNINSSYLEYGQLEMPRLLNPLTVNMNFVSPKAYIKVTGIPISNNYDFDIFKNEYTYNIYLDRDSDDNYYDDYDYIVISFQKDHVMDGYLYVCENEWTSNIEYAFTNWIASWGESNKIIIIPDYKKF